MLCCDDSVQEADAIVLLARGVQEASLQLRHVSVALFHLEQQEGVRSAQVFQQPRMRGVGAGNHITVQRRTDQFVDIVARPRFRVVPQHPGTMDVPADQHDLVDLLFSDKAKQGFAFMSIGSTLVQFVGPCGRVPDHATSEHLDRGGGALQPGPQPVPLRPAQQAGVVQDKRRRFRRGEVARVEQKDFDRAAPETRVNAAAILSVTGVGADNLLVRRMFTFGDRMVIGNRL